MKRLLVIIVALFPAIKHFAQSPQILVPFRMGDKWGYSDTLGKIRIPAKYDTVPLFDYNTVYKGDHVIAIVQFNEKPMAINEKGDIIVPPRYDFIKVMQQSAEFAFFVSNKGKFGVYKKGKELFPPIYDYMDITSYGHFKVHKDNKWGLINDAGKIVIPIAYDDLRERNAIQPDLVNWEAIEWGKDGKLITVKTNLQFEWPGLRGPGQLQEIPGYVAPEELNKAVDAAKKEFGLDSLRLDNYNGIVFKGKRQGIFLPAEAKKVYLFSRPYTIHGIKYFSSYERGYLKKHSAAYVIAVIDGKYGMINEKEEIVMPFEYDHIQEKDEFFLLKRKGKVGFFIWNSLYPEIQPIFDEYVQKYEIPANYKWNFILFKIIKQGKPGFVGENGTSYFKD
jgi:hypothetical protein